MGVESQKVEDFLHCIRMCLEYIGGVPRIIVSDNLKAAVIKPDRYEPNLNKAFADMGNHYNFAVLPARSLHPKDKALVESQVAGYTTVSMPRCASVSSTPCGN